MSDELLKRSFEVRGRDYDKAGETAADIKLLLQELALDPNTVHRAVVVAFEAEMNVVMYAQRGTITLTLTDNDVLLEITDEGPGIEDLDLAMTEGFSTATEEMRQMGFGFGMGLPNIKKNSDHLAIDSQIGIGTRLTASIHLNSNV